MKKDPHIHTPSPSFWPIVLAAGLLLIALGVVSSIVMSVVGTVVLLGAIAGWALENKTEGSPHD